MGGLEIAGIGQLRFEREKMPDRAAEDPGLLARVVMRIGIDLVGGATLAFGGPMQQSHYDLETNESKAPLCDSRCAFTR